MASIVEEEMSESEPSSSTSSSPRGWGAEEEEEEEKVDDTKVQELVIRLRLGIRNLSIANDLISDWKKNKDTEKWKLASSIFVKSDFPSPTNEKDYNTYVEVIKDVWNKYIHNHTAESEADLKITAILYPYIKEKNVYLANAFRDITKALGMNYTEITRLLPVDDFPGRVIVPSSSESLLSPPLETFTSSSSILPPPAPEPIISSGFRKCVICGKEAKFMCSSCYKSEFSVCSQEHARELWFDRGHNLECEKTYHTWDMINKEEENIGGKEACLPSSAQNICPLIPEKSNLSQKRIIEDAEHNALSAAQILKTTLAENGLNVVTIESLTSGMIAKMITDIPGSGAVLYGGFVVYDTDAKRLWGGVKTRGVYSEKTAEQMALGSLLNSRAMVSIAVTGHAMPFYFDREDIGIVDIGIAVRTEPKITVKTCRIKHCNDSTSLKGMCSAWINLHKLKDPTKSADSPGNIIYPPFQFTAIIADVIRLRTSAVAMEIAVNTIKSLLPLTNLKKLPMKSWDMECKPSWIIEKNLSGDKTKISDKEPEGCDSTDIKEIADIPIF